MFILIYIYDGILPPILVTGCHACRILLGFACFCLQRYELVGEVPNYFTIIIYYLEILYFKILTAQSKQLVYLSTCLLVTHKKTTPKKEERRGRSQKCRERENRIKIKSEQLKIKIKKFLPQGYF